MSTIILEDKLSNSDFVEGDAEERLPNHTEEHYGYEKTVDSVNGTTSPPSLQTLYSTFSTDLGSDNEKQNVNSIGDLQSSQDSSELSFEGEVVLDFGIESSTFESQYASHAHVGTPCNQTHSSHYVHDELDTPWSLHDELDSPHSLLDQQDTPLGSGPGQDIPWSSLQSLCGEQDAPRVSRHNQSFMSSLNTVVGDGMFAVPDLEQEEYFSDSEYLEEPCGNYFGHTFMESYFENSPQQTNGVAVNLDRLTTEYNYHTTPNTYIYGNAGKGISPLESSEGDCALSVLSDDDCWLHNIAALGNPLSEPLSSGSDSLAMLYNISRPFSGYATDPRFQHSSSSSSSGYIGT